VFSSRDEKLCQFLLSFGFLSSEQIKKLLFPATDKRTMLRRLRVLNHRKILNRFEVSFGGQVLWSLTPGQVEKMGSTFVIKNINKNALTHDLLVNDLRLKFEQFSVGKSWKSGHYFRHKFSANKKPEERSSDTIPDWLVTINNRVCALEVELHLKSKDRMLKVFETYSNNKAISLLWYFVPTEAMRKKLLREAIPFTNYRGKQWFKVSLVTEVDRELSMLTVPPHSVSRPR
jgi:hypothetical protein